MVAQVSNLLTSEGRDLCAAQRPAGPEELCSGADRRFPIGHVKRGKQSTHTTARVGRSHGLQAAAFAWLRRARGSLRYSRLETCAASEAQRAFNINRSAVNRMRGFTGWELLAVLAILVVVGTFLVLPSFSVGCKGRASRISCLSNLKQTAIGFRMWANDHAEAFPMAVPISKDGSFEFRNTPDVFRHFLAASNELNQPKILACPEDKERTRAIDWTAFSNSNLSYFINLDAGEGTPNAILAGDRNIIGGTLSNGYLMTLTENSQASFTSAMHEKAGNIVLADGSGAQCTPDLLTKTVRSAGIPTMRFAIPVIQASQRTGLQIPVIPLLIITAVIVAVSLYIMVSRKLVAQAASG